jgi:hypothetical protein
MKALGKAVIGGALLLIVFCVAGRAAPVTTVHWPQIIGIILAGNPVGKLTGGGEPWSTSAGRADVDLATSQVVFNVTGLVLAAGNAIGTNPVASVFGTLVCNPGKATEKDINTPAVPLSAEGRASFFGSFSKSTAACSPTSVAFLITVAPKGTTWIANGTYSVSP